MSEDLVKRPTVLPGALDASIVPAPEPSSDTIHELLAFTLDGEHYALPLATVREIVKMLPITEVPRAGGDVIGVASVRGTITTLLDLRRRLRLRERPVTGLTRILLVDAGDETLGLLVDSVLSVYRLQDDEVELAAAAGREATDYILGIGRPLSRRSTSRAGGRARDAGLGPDDILVLLDPGPLLKR